ncbi:MAG: calcium/proton exchanger, partial [Acidobacteriota bacterium]|nr:calcium/proton exchanger [Acidobacteriota bacterium]
MNWLLLFVPAAIGLHLARPEAHAAVFVLACLAVVPLAGWMGRATEELARRTGEGIGGLLNATFGNAAELILALTALHKGLYPVVKASLTGSIIGNVLLVFGAAVLAGGIRHERQRFNVTGARAQSTLLTLAAIALVMPAGFHALAGARGMARETGLSLAIAAVLLAAYGAHLVFSLITHKRLFAGEGGGGHPPEWSLHKALVVLAGSTALIAWVSEILVGSVEAAADSLGMTRVFLGVIVVAVVGNAAEHSTAVTMA